MRLEHLEAVTAAKARREASAIVVDLEAGVERVVLESRLGANDPMAERVRARFLSGESGIEEMDGRKLFLNVCVPSPRLMIIGAVHVSQVLAPMASIAGFDVSVIDPRTAFATPERFADVTLMAEWPQNILPNLGLDRYSAVACLTHDPKIDDPALELALKAECFYVGALGSRKTHAKRVERLEALGFSAEAIQRIAAPIGLSIGARSPAEIAVSVLAEVIGTLRRGRKVAIS
jgi:xanthine dehydrogenase accessory factor